MTSPATASFIDSPDVDLDVLRTALLASASRHRRCALQIRNLPGSDPAFATSLLRFHLTERYRYRRALRALPGGRALDRGADPERS